MSFEEFIQTKGFGFLALLIIYLIRSSMKINQTK